MGCLHEEEKEYGLPGSASSVRQGAPEGLTCAMPGRQARRCGTGEGRAGCARGGAAAAGASRRALVGHGSRREPVAGAAAAVLAARARAQGAPGAAAAAAEQPCRRCLSPASNPIGELSSLMISLPFVALLLLATDTFRLCCATSSGL
jgi:hypothetical protein